MKWKKLGKLFDPTEHKLPNSCVEYAQSPQALILPDRVRVFFSSRERDKTGKFLSHVLFADFTRDMRQLLGICANEVLPLGELGSFDEHGIFPFSIFADRGKTIAYTTGWSRRVSVSAETSIGYAESADSGLTFVRSGAGPIMTAALQEPFLVADAFVARFGGQLHMWYIYGLRWKKFADSQVAERVYKIAHATSPDGKNWVRDARLIIPDKIDEDECQALPTVLESNGRFHMYFCYRAVRGFREDPERAYRLGYAYSDDLISWTRDDKGAGIGVSPGDWDGEMQCYPHVFRCDNRVFMLYNGNEFGRRGFGLAELEAQNG